MHGIELVAQAPLIGHGTGSIEPLYAEISRATGGIVSVTDDPHNQILAVAIPYGALGCLALMALWGTLAFALRGHGNIAWLGQAFLIQQLALAMFFASIWIFDQGWMFIVMAAFFCAANRNLEGRTAN